MLDGWQTVCPGHMFSDAGVVVGALPSGFTFRRWEVQSKFPPSAKQPEGTAGAAVSQRRPAAAERTYYERGEADGEVLGEEIRRVAKILPR